MPAKAAKKKAVKKTAAKTAAKRKPRARAGKASAPPPAPAAEPEPVEVPPSPDLAPEPEQVELRVLPVADLIATPENRREIHEDSEAFRQLVESVRANGVRVPVHVRAHPTEAGKWDLRAGARRLRAAQLAGIETIRAIVHLAMDDPQAFDLTAIENLDREDLSPFEEAETVIELVERHGSAAAVAKRLGRGERWVVARARLRLLTGGWREAWREDVTTSGVQVWTTRHMEIIARLGPIPQGFALEVFGGRARAPSTRELQEWIDSEVYHRLRAAPWPMTDAEFSEGIACADCPLRSDANAIRYHDPDEDLGKEVRCTDPKCWKQRSEEYVERRAKVYRAEDPSLVLVSKAYYHSSDDSAALRARFGAPVLSENRYHRAKAQAPGAVRALWIDGPQAGKRTWVETYGRSGAAAPRERTPDGKPTPTPLAEKRAGLERKRWSKTLQLLRDRVRRAPIEDLQGDLFTLVAVFGLNHGNTDPGPFRIFGPDERARYPDAGDRVDPWALYETYDQIADTRRQLWLSVRAVLAERIWCNGGSEDVIAEAPRLAALLGINLAALRARAAEAYPEPKSWAKLNEDGTPKPARPKPDDGAPTPEPSDPTPALAPEGGPAQGCRYSEADLRLEAADSDLIGFAFRNPEPSDPESILLVDTYTVSRGRNPGVTYLTRKRPPGFPESGGLTISSAGWTIPEILTKRRPTRAIAEELLTGFGYIENLTPCCRECGCTEADCQQCIEKTGEPRVWVAPGLCSACAEDDDPRREADPETPEKETCDD